MSVCFMKKVVNLPELFLLRDDAAMMVLANVEARIT